MQSVGEDLVMSFMGQFCKEIGLNASAELAPLFLGEEHQISAIDAI